MRPLFPSILITLSFCLWAGFIQAQTKSYTIFDTYDTFQQHVSKYSGSTVVVNFWATYCGPCVKELPYFDALQQTYADQNVRVILVNLDFVSQLEQRLKPFLEKHHIKSEIVVLGDQDADIWVPKVSSLWNGELPFTTVLKKGKQGVHPQEFRNYEDLEKWVLPFLDRRTAYTSEGSRP